MRTDQSMGSFHYRFCSAKSRHHWNLIKKKEWEVLLILVKCKLFFLSLCSIYSITSFTKLLLRFLTGMFWASYLYKCLCFSIINKEDTLSKKSITNEWFRWVLVYLSLIKVSVVNWTVICGTKWGRLLLWMKFWHPDSCHWVLDLHKCYAWPYKIYLITKVFHLCKCSDYLIF